MKKEFFQSSTWVKVNPLISPRKFFVFLKILALIDSRQCAGSEEEVSQRIDALNDQWEGLLAKSNEKTQKLKEANQQQLFNTGVKDIDFWLGEVSDHKDWNFTIQRAYFSGGSFTVFRRLWKRFG